ncbi:unnamed protein product [Rotaria sp. Silwood2]|nr:unnamed protein product [Rotaria sp. Silwood2]
MRRDSNSSFLAYVNDKRRTSTILLKPISYPKYQHHHHHHRHHHQKEKQTFLIDEGKRLIPIHSNLDSNSNFHRIQIQEMRRELKQALDNIRYIAAHCAHESLIESIRDEWKFIATVIDRLQFFIFLKLLKSV